MSQYLVLRLTVTRHFFLPQPHKNLGGAAGRKTDVVQCLLMLVTVVALHQQCVGLSHGSTSHVAVVIVHDMGVANVDVDHAHTQYSA